MRECLNHGVVITVPKPNKPAGSCANLRPITLLSTTRKAISTVILHRIRSKVDAWLSPNQSGFRVARSTADAVWAHRWNVALTHRFRTSMYILGIDLSKAFDSIDRHRLLTVLASFLDSEEVQLIKALLSTTTLQLRLNMCYYSTFSSNHGTPQGDALSPLLFVV